MTRAGGSRAYGKWAHQKIKNKKGALLSTFGLGVLIFVDDYFNCLTVGSVMREVCVNLKYHVLNWLISLIVQLHQFVSLHLYRVGQQPSVAIQVGMALHCFYKPFRSIFMPY